ncbi:MAG: ATP-binding protein [Micrococcales bacterium]|nr:ATP-binding protein [Micrococcales bacterium]
MNKQDDLVTRRLMSTIRERMRDEPALLLQGPRTVGKSTLLRQIRAEVGGDYVDLDDTTVEEALRGDPSAFVDVPGPVLIDEYQRVPEVLRAIKTVLNQAPTRPGRFVLTGSARHESLPMAAEALTGRLHRMEILPLAQCELEQGRGLLGRLVEEGEEVARERASSTTRADYIRRIVGGGFPLARGRSDGARSRWFDDYLRLTLERDVGAVYQARQASSLPDVLKRLASQTAQVLNRSKVANTLGIEDTTVAGHVRILEAVFLLRLLPAWDKRLSARTASSPKIHFVDSGVAAHLARLTATKLERRDPTALTEFGHLLETFVVGELLKEVSWMDGIAAVGHWRTFDGHEVDLVIEGDDGRVFAFEVKAGRRVGADAFRGLGKLRSALGDAFACGVLLHTGERSFRFDDRLLALPVDRLWSTHHPGDSPTPNSPGSRSDGRTAAEGGSMA